jgi:hypothetical protein
MSKATFSAINCSVLHLDAGHDPSGNPKRLYLVLCMGETVAALDEGYLGSATLDQPWGRPVGEVLRHNVTQELKVAKSEYKRLLKGTPTKTVVL